MALAQPLHTKISHLPHFLQKKCNIFMFGFV